MKDIKLKKAQKIRIIRDRIGALDSNSRSEFETTVGEAFKNGYFATSHGTMNVWVNLVDHENADYNGESVYTKDGAAYARVREDWEIEMGQDGQ
jgi:hypothetical protein